MSMPARAALLLLLSLGFVRLFAAETDELASLRAKAEHGNALAQYNLGLAYAEGRQVPANPAEAFAWLSLASENGATGKALDSLLGNISDAQLAEGRRRLDRYRASVSNQITDTKAHGTPKLAPRGFTVEVPPTPPATPTPPPVTNPPPAAEPAVPPGRSPAAVTPPAATTPAGGNNATDLDQARKDLEKAQVDLVNANNELATLHASVTRLEAAASEAKATETRLTAELAAARQELAALKPAVTPPPAEKTAVAKPAPHQP
jgi:hypothetical protein